MQDDSNPVEGEGMQKQPLHQQLTHLSPLRLVPSRVLKERAQHLATRLIELSQSNVRNIPDPSGVPGGAGVRQQSSRTSPTLPYVLQ